MSHEAPDPHVPDGSFDSADFAKEALREHQEARELSPAEKQQKIIELQREQLMGLVEGHHSSLAGLNANYELALSQAEPAEARGIIQRMSEDVPTRLRETKSAVLEAIDISTRSIAAELSPNDQALREEIRSTLKISGLINPDRLRGYIAQAENPAAMAALLDRAVTRELDEALGLSTLGGKALEEIFALFSSDEVQMAMRAAFDLAVHEKSGAWIREYGINSSYVTELLSFASGQDEAQAIRGSFDTFVDEKTAHDANRYGADSWLVADDIKLGSNRHVRSFLSKMYRGVDTGESETDINDLIARVPGAGWLSGEDPALVRGVIAEVNKLRGQKDNKGEPLTDRKIYLAFRSASMQAEREQSERLAAHGANRQQDITPTVEQTRFLILNALMQSDPSEPIPF